MAKSGERTPVLVIEDDADICKFVCRVLELEGYSVGQAEDGSTALRLMNEKPFAVVLLDLRLPNQSGWEVLQEMKNNPALSAIPVVVVTASAAVEQRDRALAMGATDYVVKPLSASALRKAVTNALKGRG